MASKKYTSILALLILFSSAVFAQQNDAAYDWRDSSKISTKNLPQHSEFLNNQYPYPARPREQFELGISGGLAFIVGDVSPTPGFGGSLSVRKAINHAFSWRVSYVGTINTGIDYRTTNPSQLPSNNVGDPYLRVYGPTNTPFVAAFRNQVHQGTFEIVGSLLNASHFRGNPKWDLYGYGGYSLVVADVDVDAVQANGQRYNYSSVNFSGTRADIRDQVKSIMDLEYESNAGVTNGNRNNAGRVDDNQLLRHAVTGGAGLSKKLSDKVNIGIEQRFTFAFDDNMDGINKGRSNDFFSFTSLRLNINLGNPAKKVQPLWWTNPYNFIYNEINAPQHMKLPKPVLPDADGDGVTDQFDMEPSTPQGAPVDVRGVAKDSDGDGVPDYKDKELLTQQKCFPVDADGVGTCPDPACCKELRDSIATWRERLGTGGDCGITNLPSVQFKSGSASLSRDAQAVLAGAASQIKANPGCRIKIIGYGVTNKRAQQLSWDRVNTVIRYFVEKQGIAEDRFLFIYAQEGGDANTVDLQGTTEEGPNTVPAPHPNMKQ